MESGIIPAPIAVIKVKQIHDCWLAYVNSDSSLYGTGITKRDAIGDVIIQHAENFGIVIEDGK